MATTKIWSIRGDVGHVLRYVQDENKTEPGRQPDALDAVLSYVGRGDKTEAQQFVSGINCAPDVARTEMMAVKRHFSKTDGINNRLVCFDIKELGKQLKNLGMLVIQDQVWNRVTVNRSEGKATRY